MSSSRHRAALVALALLAPVLLGACSSFRPVYGETGLAAERIALSYAKPASRLEQIIIQEIAGRLGADAGPGAPVFSVTASSSARTLTQTRVTKPVTQREVQVTASYQVVSDGVVVVSGTRRATASYATSGQVLADESALKDATERAGRAVAETIRLSLIAAIGNAARLAPTGT